MNYGMYVAASGMLVNTYRLDVIGNNLANVNTAGFKPDAVAFRWREAERIEAGLTNMPAQKLLERLGGGVHVAPNFVRHERGETQRTGNPLDLAIKGPGFLTLENQRGKGADRFRFTRDGRLATTPEGYLVHAASGMRVLDEGDRPIRIPGSGAVEIAEDGSVMHNGASLGRLRVAAPRDAAQLKKTGTNLFALEPGVSLSSLQAPVGVVLRPGHLEGSATDAMQAMMELASASSAVGANARMIQFHDDLMNAAINRLGRVS